MYAVLGDIQFDLITYFDGFESTFSADYAEHAMIAGKPRLQYVGLALDEISIALAFHHLFCDPEAELAKLKEALANHQAMALVLGNGDYKGWFVLTDVQATAQQTDTKGAIVALEASLTLREYVGDPANPLPPPAVQPETPPAQAVATPEPPAAAPQPGGMLDNIGSAVSLAAQAKSAISTVSDMVATAQRLASNPAAALARVPGLLGSLNDALVPLNNLPASLSTIRDHLPMAASVLRAGNAALFDMQGAADMLEGASAANVAGKIAAVSGLVGASSDAMSTVSSGIGKAAAKLVTRSA